MEFSRSKKKHNDLDLIPLINVVFMLLIFFMVAGTIENIDIFDVTVPKSENSTDKIPSKTVIYIAADGKIAVNDDMVAESDLKTIISTLFINNPEQEVTIKADFEVPAKKLVTIMNLIEKSGGKRISLVTQTGDK